MYQEFTEQHSESITHYFFKAWMRWEEGLAIDDWYLQSMAMSAADTYLYQAVQLAGLKMPLGYRLPRKKS